MEANVRQTIITRRTIGQARFRTLEPVIAKSTVPTLVSRVFVNIKYSSTSGSGCHRMNTNGQAFGDSRRLRWIEAHNGEGESHQEEKSHPRRKVGPDPLLSSLLISNA